MSDGGELGGRPPVHAPAGWFLDPYDQSALRYWDGARWTEFVAPVPAVPVPSWTSGPTVRTKAPSAGRGGKGRRYLPRTWLGKAGAGLAGTVLLLVAVGQAQSPAVERPTAAGSSNVSSASPSPRVTATPSTTPAAVVPPQTSPTPTLGGLTIAQANARLLSAGLVLGSVTRVASSSAPGTVISQGMPAGTAATKGSRVNLVVAAPFPKVPAVVGKSRATATSQLSAVGFVVRVNIRTVSHGTQGAVLGQSPSAGASVKPGSQVSIVVAKVVTPPPATPEPDPSSSTGQACTPGYDPCLPPASDYDCAGGSGNGPEYVYGTVRVTGSDPYGLDRDHDGYGCD